MDKGIFATVEHRKLMELKNCGATDAVALEDLARLEFVTVKDRIKEVRAVDKPKGFFARLFDLSLPIDREVDLMFGSRQELIDHLVAVDVPTDLCPITETDKERLVFIDRAAKYAIEAQKILDMFKRHHEVIVDSDRSVIIDWVLQNQVRIRAELSQGA